MPEGERAKAAARGGGEASPAGSAPAGQVIRLAPDGAPSNIPPQLLKLMAGPGPQHPPQQSQATQPPPEEPVPEKAPDSGLLCLTLILRFFHEAADPDKLRHEYGKTEGPLTEDDLVRLGRRQKLLARAVSTGWDRLEKTPLPAIAPLLDGRFVVLARAAEGKVLIQDP